MSSFNVLYCVIAILGVFSLSVNLFRVNMVFIFYYTGLQKIFYQVIYQIILIRIDIFLNLIDFQLKKQCKLHQILKLF